MKPDEQICRGTPRNVALPQRELPQTDLHQREMQVLRASLEAEDRLLACKEALYLRNRCYERKPSREEAETTAAAMAEVLKTVPPGLIVGLMREEIQHRTDSFPPVGADLLRRFHGDEVGSDGEGNSCRQARANAGAYELYADKVARAAQTPVLPLPTPTRPLAELQDELRAELDAMRSRSSATQALKQINVPDDPTVARYGAGVTDLARVGNIALEKCSAEQIALLRRFGCWWQKYRGRVQPTRESLAELFPVFEARNRYVAEAKAMALEFVACGELSGAIDSLLDDLAKNPDTALDLSEGSIPPLLLTKPTEALVRTWIEGVL